MIDYTTLDPGIRAVVKLLNDNGFTTTDSGDGKTKTDMECALPFPNVVVASTPETMVADADAVVHVLKRAGVVFALDAEGAGPCVEATYIPTQHTGAFILVRDIDDSMLTA